MTRIFLEVEHLSPRSRKGSRLEHSQGKHQWDVVCRYRMEEEQTDVLFSGGFSDLEKTTGVEKLCGFRMVGHKCISTGGWMLSLSMDGVPHFCRTLSLLST